MSFLNKIIDWLNPGAITDLGQTNDNVVKFRRQNNPDLSQLKVSELKSLAKERGFKGYTALRKNELIDLLNQ